ncbi:hypothetical protein PsW64_01550 [Pseudovibrio sp. W64]|nr:hypothetical protein PsW64_01550 [Pseudovibrio sp. W64]
MLQSAAGFGNLTHGIEKFWCAVGWVVEASIMQAATVLQLTLVVETEEIWRTNCIIGAANFLSFIDQVVPTGPSVYFGCYEEQQGNIESHSPALVILN